MRLLFCSACKSIDEVPDNESTETNRDPLMEEIIERHTSRDPMAHGGERLHFSPFRIATIDDEAWASNPEGVLKTASEYNKSTGFDVWAYDTRNQYADDAMKCFNEHHRPTDRCMDFWSDSKLLGRPTKEGQAVLKENFKMNSKEIHLCSFCPFLSKVNFKQREKRGLYKALRH